MINLLKRAFAMALISFSAAFAVPTTWNINPNDSKYIEIKDEHMNVIEVQMLEGPVSGFKMITINGIIYNLPNLDDIAPANVVPSARRLGNAFSNAPTSTLRDSSQNTGTMNWQPISDFPQVLGKRSTPLDGFTHEPSRTGVPPTNPCINASVPTSQNSVIDLKERALKHAVCWRVSPKNRGYFELLDEEGVVLYSDKIEKKNPIVNSKYIHT